MNNLQEIPQQLKDLPNWVQWKLELKDGRETKVPYVSGTTTHASCTNPETWSTFEAAVANQQLTKERGIGFVIHGSAVEAKLIGFDLDGCRNIETGELTPWAEEILAELDSYAEITPSDTGIRVWVRGQLPQGDRVFNLNPDCGHGNKVKVEVFEKARYFCMTGNAVYDSQVGIKERDLTNVYKMLHAIRTKHAVTPKPAKTESTSATSKSAQIKSSGLIITNKLTLLMTGAIKSERPFIVEDNSGNSLEYPSQSEADLSLATELAFLYDDKEKISSEFAKSCLAQRSKWQRQDYQNNTIDKAIITARAKKQETQTPEITDEVLDREFPSYDGEDVGPIPTLIENFLPKGANFFGSLSGVGKTWLGLSVAKALTSGEPLFGVFPVKEKVAVLYLIPEASNATFKNRMKLMKICRDKKLFRYRTISQGVTLPLKDPLTVRMIQKLRDHGRCQVLVVVDTAIRFLHAKDENASTDNSLVGDSDYLRSKDIGADLLFMHHSPKASKKEAELTLENVLRGTGDFGAMADVVYGIRRDENLFAYGEGPEELDVVCVKPRDLENPPLPFRVVLKRKDTESGRPVSVINETGDVLYVGPEAVKSKAGNLLDYTLRQEPYSSLNNLTKVLKMRRELVKDLAKVRGWTHVVEIVFGPDGKPVKASNGLDKKRFRWTQVVTANHKAVKPVTSEPVSGLEPEAEQVIQF